MGLFKWIMGGDNRRHIKKLRKIVDKINALEPTYKAMSDDELKGMTQKFRERIAAGATLDSLIPEAFAVVREASVRVTGLRHYDVQMMGGIVLHQGRIAEMKTGEGKTLTETLPAYLNALSGKGVHIVTVNDYLAKRDAEWMGKIPRFLGMTVGVVYPNQSRDEKRRAYACDITYGTNNEFGFDYLRDNMVVYENQKMQRGHNFCIVDEVDSILIDEARTPLIISGKGKDSSTLYQSCQRFVRRLRESTNVDDEGKVINPNEEPDGDYDIDKKKRAISLTVNGIIRAERDFGIENLADAEHSELNHYINNALRANYIMKKDVDYIVKDGEIIIVDEFTGRLMPGRRYSDGLHQAIEAKENVKIQSENMTLATITFQNYFRLYTKLSGMTGTAKTEETEFKGIYGLDVVVIPPNIPSRRVDETDKVFASIDAKLRAVVADIEECTGRGQPVLVGTTNVEKSEELSRMLRKKKIIHNVLNAKNHEKEADIVAQAGRFGAVTIATNMAGRGTDILLGGNAEYLARNKMKKDGIPDEIIELAMSHMNIDPEAVFAVPSAERNASGAEVLEARETYNRLYKEFKQQTDKEKVEVEAVGGLRIIGTERHESRRIDNQLRGRAGRQGDPGETRFYLSLEDDIMRLFGSERIMNMMNSLGIDEDTPIDAKMLSNAIENAQKNVESRNFQMRKNVLEYDDVMNTQRQVIYEQRQKVLDGEDLSSTIEGMIHYVIDTEVEDAFAGADHCDDPEKLAQINAKFEGVYYPKGAFAPQPGLSRDEAKEQLYPLFRQTYAAREQEFGAERMREIERIILLRVVDEYWMDNIDAMEDLKQGIRLRAYGQTDPVVAYKREGFAMFDGMINAIREETVRRLYLFRLRTEEDIRRKQVAKITATGGAADKTVKQQPVKKIKIGANDPCPCGSGKKYKYCCRDKDEAKS